MIKRRAVSQRQELGNKLSWKRKKSETRTASILKQIKGSKEHNLLGQDKNQQILP